MVQAILLLEKCYDIRNRNDVKTGFDIQRLKIQSATQSILFECISYTIQAALYLSN